MGGIYLNRLIVRLVIVVAVALLPAIGAIVYQGLQFRTHNVEDTVMDLNGSVNDVSRRYLHQIQATHLLLYSLAQIPEVRLPDAAACQALCARIKGFSRFYDNIGLIGKDGYVLVSAVPVSGSLYLGDRKHVQQAIQSRDFTTSKLQMSRILLKPTLVCNYPVLDGSGEVQGVLFANLNMGWLQEMMEEARLPSGSDLTVTDEHGNVLAHYPHPKEWIGKSLPPRILEVIRKEGKGTLEAVGADGVLRLYAFTALGKNPVGCALAGTSVAVVYAAAYKALRVNLVFLGISVVLALGLAWIMGLTTITRPVKRLVRTAGQLSEGDLSARIGSLAGPGEFVHLSQAFDRMAESLQQRDTERSRSERLLRESEERFRNVFEQGPVGIAIVGLDYRWVAVNEALCEMVGYTEAELTKLTFVDITHPDDIEADVGYAEKLVRGEIPSYTMEKRYIKKNGEDIWINLTVSIIRDDEGKSLYYLSMIEDISERKEAEETIRRQHGFLRNVLESLTHPFFVLNATDYTIQIANSAALHGSSSGATTCYALSHGRNEPCNTSDHPCPIDQVKHTRQPVIVEHVHYHKDGTMRYVEVHAYPILDSEGNVSQVIEYTLDITERKEAEETVRHSERTLRSLVDGNPESLFMIDPEGVVLIANQEVARRFGTTVSELIGSSMYDFLPADVAEERKKHVQEVIRTGKLVRFEDTRFGRTIDNHVQPIVDQQETVVSLALLGIDITNLRKAEQVQRLLATAIEQSAEAVVITDVEGVIQYVNPAAEQITGFERSEIIGNNPRIFKSGEHDRTFYEQLWNTITAGNVWSGRIINKKKDGALYQEDATISPVRDASGKIVNFVAVKRDVTEHLELSRQLFQAQKMEAIGTLAGGIAHDFNNILTIVMGFSDLLLMNKDEQDPDHADLQKINQAALKGADLVQRLLAFSRKAEFRPRPLNLNHQIVQLQKMLTRTISKMIEIELNLADGLSPVNADPTQMDQVLMNLAVNAKDAMPDGGKLTVQTANIFLDEEYARAHLQAKPGEYVLLSVSDTGHGMDKETLTHIFEPFYTTKEAGKGTGLGLAMVYGLVKQHGGYITCYSEPGEGTTFKMYFPVIELEIDQDVTKSGEMPAFGTETILLVDDEEFVRDLGKRILERSGYTVLTAANGKEALDLYRREKGKISLVILDLVMPEMGGKQCLEELLKIDPQVKTLIASGFAANGQTKEAIETGARGFVGKPYKVKQVLQLVRQVLDSE